MINPFHPLARGLVGLWLMNEGSGSGAYDISGKNNHGTLTNMATNSQSSGWSGSKFGMILNFDGTDDYVNIPNIIDTYGAISVSFWSFVATSDVKSSSAFGGYGISSTTDRLQCHAPWTDNNLYFDYGNQSGGRISTNYSNYLDKWTHICLVSEGKNGNFKAIYLDGVLANHDSVSDGPDGDITIDIGRAALDTTPYQKGKMDHFRIYNRVLSDKEVKQIHQNPFADIITPSVLRLYSPSAEPTDITGRIPRIQTNTKPKPGATLDRLNPINDGVVGYWLLNERAGSTTYDISGKNNHGVISGASWVGSNFGGGLYCDGDDHVTISDLDIPGSLSVSVWFKPTTLLAGWHSLVVKSYDYGFELEGDVLYGRIGDVGWSCAPYTTIQTNTWYHAVISYDGTTCTLYVNGTQVDSGTGSHTTNDSVLYFSTWDGTMEYFDGIIDNVKIYDRALSAFEVEQLYHSPFTGILQPSLYFTTVEEELTGWTGTINGVTNPAKIYGIPVANIVKVSGVA